MTDLDRKKKRYSGGELPQPSLDEALKGTKEGVDVVTNDLEDQDEQS